MLSRMPVVFADNILTKNNSQLTTLAHSGVTIGGRCQDYSEVIPGILFLEVD